MKNDTTKVRLDLVPPEAIVALGEVLTFGAQKYAPREWEQGMEWGRVYAAALRHLLAWWGRGGPDAESGLSHLAHALVNVAFLLAYERRGVGEDDRPGRKEDR